MKKTLFVLIFTLLTGCVNQASNIVKKQDIIKSTDWSSLILELAKNDGFHVIEHEYMLTIIGNEDDDLGRWSANARANYAKQLEGIEHHTRRVGENLVMDWFPSKL